MKATYRGHEIEATRERSLGGDVLLYYSVFRLGDGYEVASGFTDSADTVRDMIASMKRRVDAEIADGETFEPSPPEPQ